MTLLSRKRPLIASDWSIKSAPQASTQVISSTTAADTGMTITVQSPGPTAEWLVMGSLDINVAGGAGVLVVELVVDGVVASGQLVTQMASAARVSGHKEWRVTGLAAGARVIKLQGSLATTGSTFSIGGTQSALTVVRIN